MKTKVFEPGAICAAVALLVVFSLPVYAKNGGSSSAHTRVGKTSANVTPSKQTQSGTGQKSAKKALPTATANGKGSAYKDVPRGAENDIAANAGIARMQAAKGAQADVKGAMQQVKDPNRRSRTYKPYQG